MPHIIFVATDIFGQKLNYELEFPAQPSVMELLNHVESVFSAEQSMRKPGGAPPYKVSKLNVVDEATEGWVEVVNQSQLKKYCQVYAFQPHSTQATESQGHIPTPIRPRHLQVATGGGMHSASPIMAAAGSRGPSVQSYGQAVPVIQSGPPAHLPPVVVPPVAVSSGLAQVKLLPADASHDEKVRAAFEGLDANANQVIEAEELKRGFQMFGIDFSHATTEDLFRKADIDRDGVINFAEWQRFCELYPTLLDSLYYRLKSHWEITAATMDLEQFASHRAALEEAERNSKNEYDRTQIEADEAERRLLDLERAASDTSAKQRAAEENARESMRDVERSQQNRQARERALAAEKERERQAHLASQHSARDLDTAQRKLATTQSNMAEVEALERRLQGQLAEALREIQRLKAVSDQNAADVAAASDRHNRVLSEMPTRAVEECTAALAQAEQDCVVVENRQRELDSVAQAHAAAVADVMRAQEEGIRQASALRDRQEPARNRWAESQLQLENFNRQLAEREDVVNKEINEKRLMYSQEKALVEQEVKLREQRESLEEKEGALRSAHSTFFQPQKVIYH
eukprot:TRINITY_DN4957_c2_g1_i1.p1 TRINITY_DN4957_c2_g1~~TRINITY_DN4957_c2_g1_i1.p1  ORF type:complete len:593 (+),score=136.14 TRINITY_DN4957_c2_g1_i1:55-1779(+)